MAALYSNCGVYCNRSFKWGKHDRWFGWIGNWNFRNYRACFSCFSLRKLKCSICGLFGRNVYSNGGRTRCFHCGICWSMYWFFMVQFVSSASIHGRHRKFGTWRNNCSFRNFDPKRTLDSSFMRCFSR